ncbi:PREDICTED: secreted Ly-6/uPAR-related protein 1 [Condylura cristata]|uniref:secreted Ly-6/uPAR-related protein 1 n=1 Tax=Condylura cristata TaxID=143302 RepID=UPI000642950C|nr:PREDICTED: secreted Ly-6/uPAR-related protein 1 [Condylura cristata]
MTSPGRPKLPQRTLAAVRRVQLGSHRPPGRPLGRSWPRPDRRPPRPGEALRCFTCEQPTPESSCTNVTRCQPEHTACRTALVTGEAEFPFQQRPLVTRSCARSCMATDPDSIGDAHLVLCCFRDLCGSAGAARLATAALAALLAHLFP